MTIPPPIASVALGIVATACAFLPMEAQWLGIVFGAAGLAMGRRAARESGERDMVVTAGKLCSGVGLGLSAVGYVVFGVASVVKLAVGA